MDSNASVHHMRADFIALRKAEKIFLFNPKHRDCIFLINFAL